MLDVVHDTVLRCSVGGHDLAKVLAREPRDSEEFGDLRLVEVEKVVAQPQRSQPPVDADDPVELAQQADGLSIARKDEPPRLDGARDGAVFVDSPHVRRRDGQTGHEPREDGGFGAGREGADDRVHLVEALAILFCMEDREESNVLGSAAKRAGDELGALGKWRRCIDPVSNQAIEAEDVLVVFDTEVEELNVVGRTNGKPARKEICEFRSAVPGRTGCGGYG